MTSWATFTQMIEHCKATRSGKESFNVIRGSEMMVSRDVQYLESVGLKRSIRTCRNLSHL